MTLDPLFVYNRWVSYSVCDSLFHKPSQPYLFVCRIFTETMCGSVVFLFLNCHQSIDLEWNIYPTVIIRFPLGRWIAYVRITLTLFGYLFSLSVCVVLRPVVQSRVLDMLWLPLVKRTSDVSFFIYVLHIKWSSHNFLFFSDHSGLHFILCYVWKLSLETDRFSVTLSDVICCSLSSFFFKVLVHYFVRYFNGWPNNGQGYSQNNI